MTCFFSEKYPQRCNPKDPEPSKLAILRTLPLEGQMILREDEFLEKNSPKIPSSRNGDTTPIADAKKKTNECRVVGRYLCTFGKDMGLIAGLIIKIFQPFVSKKITTHPQYRTPNRHSPGNANYERYPGL